MNIGWWVSWIVLTEVFYLTILYFNRKEKSSDKGELFVISVFLKFILAFSAGAVILAIKNLGPFLQAMKEALPMILIGIIVLLFFCVNYLITVEIMYKKKKRKVRKK